MARGNGKAKDLEPKIRTISAQTLSLRQVTNSNWTVIAPEGMTPADLEGSAAWSAISAARMTPCDRIEVKSPDGLWWAETLIVRTIPLTCKVLRTVEFDDIETTVEAMTVPAGYSIFLDRVSNRWMVRRQKDNFIMKGSGGAGFSTKNEAFLYLQEHPAIRQAPSTHYVV